MKSAIFLLSLILVGIAFQNCAPKSEQREIAAEGVHEFVDHGCMEGYLCKAEGEVDCYEPELWYAFDETTVCPLE